MTHPGDLAIADNEFFPAPYAGDICKTQPPVAHEGYGFPPEFRVPPDWLNWYLNRLALHARNAARTRLSNWLDLVIGMGLGTAGCTLLPGCHLRSRLDRVDFLVLNDGVNDNIQYSQHGLYSPWFNDAIIASGFHGRIGAADGGNATVRRSYVGTGVNNFGQTSVAFGVWNPLVIVVAPSFFGTLDCDQNQAAAPVWVAGGVTGAGGRVLVRSADGINYAVPAVMPAALGTFGFVGHSHHYADAVSPDDLGNAHWIALDQNDCLASTDGDNWVAAPHGFTNPPTNRSLAYSRSSRKWIAVDGNAGDIWTSIDNGATWVLEAARLGFVSWINQPEIYSDGYGSFLVIDYPVSTAAISVDEGKTWSSIDLPFNTAVMSMACGHGDIPLTDSHDLEHAGGFSIFWHDDAGGNLTTFSTLRG